MKLTPIAANRNVISYNNGSEVFFSYSTPVAGYCPDKGYLRTEDWYSQTTTKHINKYLDGITNYATVSQQTINNLVGN
tara:strand:- start:542 stop:775 length:234 start_codon:yes stop_codon:yes gene_type:complete